MIFEDMILKDPNLLILKNKDTGEIIQYEIQENVDNINQQGTILNKQNLGQFETDIIEKAKVNVIQEDEEVNEQDVYSSNAIRKMIEETVLFENVDGISTTVTLANSCTNYKYVEVYFKSNAKACASLKIDDPNNKYICLNVIDDNAAEELWAKMAKYQFVDNKLNFIKARHKSLLNAQTGTDNSLKIAKIVGYK